MEESAIMVYLAGPVRSIGRTSATAIRGPLEIYFMRRGMVTFNPPGAWGAPIIGSDAVENTVQRGNDTMLTMCGILAAIFVPGVESKGTEGEVILAARLRIPIIVVVHDREEISAAIAWINPLIGQASIPHSLAIEFAVLKGSKMDTITIISYDPTKEEAVA